MLEMMSLAAVNGFKSPGHRLWTQETLIRRVSDSRHYSRQARLYYAMLLTAYGL